MPRKRAIAFSSACIPHFRHAVLGARDDSQRVGRERPNALYMAKVRAEALVGCGVPETDRAVESTSQDVAGRKPSRNVCEARAKGLGGRRLGRCGR